MPTPRQCKYCKQPSKVVLFTLEKGKWISTSSGSKEIPNVCLECANKHVSLNCETFNCGYLFKADSKKYIESASSSSLRDRFIREGIVVVPLDEMQGSFPFVDAVSRLVKRDNLSERVKFKDLKDAIDQTKMKKQNNPDRKWINIWGDTDAFVKNENKAAKFVKHSQHLGLEIEKHLFPEIYYARKMVDKKRETFEHIYLENSLICNKINLLARFAGLNTDQHLHRDSIKFGLAVIFILKCHHKYCFKYVQGSHELSYGENYVNYNVVSEDFKTLLVEKNNFIIFATNLIHCGGPSSINTITTGKNEKSSESELSDLSLHVDFFHEGLSRGATRSNGETIIWPFELDKGDGQDYDNVYKYNGESPEFQKAFEEATSLWIDNYGGGRRKSKRRL